MSTLSVPLTDDMRSNIKMLVKQGVAPNEATVARKAIRHYLEDQAVEAVLRAQKEPSLSGDLDDLASQL
jgi:Arc/MetJ-type ribon-helix-helix transcriptional regulator